MLRQKGAVEDLSAQAINTRARRAEKVVDGVEGNRDESYEHPNLKATDPSVAGFNFIWHLGCPAPGPLQPAVCQRTYSPMHSVQLRSRPGP